jgi:hypothetical protein
MKRKTRQELAVANELAFQNEEKKENRAAELIIANKELAYKMKKNRAAELIIANKELAYKMTKRKIVQLN